MAQGRALGFLGGSFDPIHKGHLNLAKGVRRLLRLDKVYLIPNAAPPHKAGNFSSYESRLQMTDLALLSLNHRQYQVSRLEEEEGTRHYTFDTLKLLRAKYGEDARLYFIMGMDSLLDLDTWHRGFELTNFANLAVIGRPGFDLNACPKPDLKAYINEHLVLDPAFAADKSIKSFEDFTRALKDKCGNIFILKLPEIDISSTQLRAELARVSAARSQRQLGTGARAAEGSVSARLQGSSAGFTKAESNDVHLLQSDILQRTITPQVLNYITEHQLYSKK